MFELAYRHDLGRSNGTHETIPRRGRWRTVARALARASNEPASPPYRRVSNTQTGTRTGFTCKRGDVNISVDLQTAAADNANRLPHGACHLPTLSMAASRADKSLGTVKSKQMKSLG